MAEDFLKVIEIQQKLGLDDLVQPHRRLICEGPVQKENEKKGKSTLRRALSTMLSPYYLFLFSDVLVLAKRKKKLAGEEERFSYKETVRLDDLSIEILGTDAFALYIGSNRRQVRLIADSEAAAARWILDIEKAMTVYQVRDAVFFLLPNLPLQESKQTLKLEKPPEQTPTPTPAETTTRTSDYRASADELISMFPTIPTPQVGGSIMNMEKKPATLSQLLDIYRMVFELNKQLFQQQVQSANFYQIQDLLNQLERKKEELKEYRDSLDVNFQQQEAMVKFDQTMQEGQGHISNLSHWVGFVFPKSSTDPNAPKARELTAYTMKWYIDLVTDWQNLTDNIHTK